MSRRIKLVWDFFGPESKEFALHHKKHLQQYAEANNLTNSESGTAIENDNQHFAFLIVDEADMISVRDTLKPVRGFEILNS